MASRTLRRRATYRAFGKHSTHRSRPLLRAAILLFVAIAMLTSGASAATILFYGQNLPSLQHFKSKFQFQNTQIRDDQGHLIYSLADLSNKNRGNRVIKPLAWPGQTTAYYASHGEDWLHAPGPGSIPIILQNATIATEDATFWSNPGFDPLSILRAEYDNVVAHRVVSGASTITQQLVRRYLLDPKPTLTRKTQEILLAAELTQKYPKSKILWYYLNSISYRNLAIGAEAAAQTYFHEHVWKLDLAESALLAGLPELPTVYDPVTNLPAALARMAHVLKLMYQHGYLKLVPGQTQTDAINSIMTSKEVKSWHFAPPVTVNKYPHFVQYALNELQNIPQLRSRMYDGLDVWTTLDPQLQKVAETTVKNQISTLGAYHVTDGALVSMSLDKNCLGCIRAMVGSADYHNKSIAGQINMADSPRQPGSSFKPFSYVLGFMNGLAPGTSVYDGPIAIPDQGNPEDGGWYEPTNYDHLWHGTVTLRTALANSLNIPAIKVEQYNASLFPDGLQHIEKFAQKMGLTSITSDNPKCCGWALTLGGMERGTRLVEETAAYGTFGNNGTTVPPVAIWKVWDRNTHKLIYDAMRDEPVKPTQVFDPAYAYVMTNVLSDNNSRCAIICEFGLTSPLYLGRPAAAKTGTTNSFTDNWTVGYTPDLVTGVWVGNADNSPMVGTTGVTGAAPIWHDYMLSALDILKIPPKPFIEPPHVYAGTSCLLDGAYTSYGTMGYDIYAGSIPHCSVGTASNVLPQNAPVPNTQIQPTAAAPVPTYAAPTAPPVVPTPIPPTQAPAYVPGATSGNGVTQQAPVVTPAAPAPTTPAQSPPAQQSPVQQVPAQGTTSGATNGGTAGSGTTTNTGVPGVKQSP